MAITLLFWILDKYGRINPNERFLYLQSKLEILQILINDEPEIKAKFTDMEVAFITEKREEAVACFALQQSLKPGIADGESIEECQKFFNSNVASVHRLVDKLENKEVKTFYILQFNLHV